MNIVSTTILRNNLADVLKSVAKDKDYLLISKKGKPVSALVNLDFFEDLLALTSKKYLKSIEEARADYKQGRVFTMDEVFGEIE